MKKIVEEPVLKSLDAVVASVIEVRPLGAPSSGQPDVSLCMERTGRVCGGCWSDRVVSEFSA